LERKIRVKFSGNNGGRTKRVRLFFQFKGLQIDSILSRLNRSENACLAGNKLSFFVATN